MILYQCLKEIIVIWSFMVFQIKGETSTERPTDGNDVTRAFINSFSITKQENKNIKLVYQSAVSINLTLEILEVRVNESTSFDISLMITNTKNVLFQKQYTVKKKDMSGPGVITVQFPIKGDYFTEMGFYNVSLVAHLRNSSVFNESIPLSISYDEEIRKVHINCSQHIRIGSIANLTAYVDQGHSVGLFWNWIIAAIHINKTVQTIEYTSRSTQIFNISKAGKIIVLITVQNGVSNISTSCNITSLYPINGYELYSTKKIYNTTETALFKIDTNKTKGPVGLVNMKVFFPSFLETALTDSNVSRFELTYAFKKQGLYEVLIELRSEIEVKNMSIYIDIWDELNYLEVKPSKSYARAGEKISFLLKNPPPSNFYYNISFGDGSEESRILGTYSESFVLSMHGKTYNQAGTYIISIIAWNEKYERKHSMTVYVQYPIQLLNITPDNYDVPLPDGIVDFTIRHEGYPLPSNVTCSVGSVGYRDIGTKTKNNVFNNTFFYSFRLIFTDPDQYSINVSCKNDVSSYHLEPYVNVTEIKMSDILIVYQNPSPMNMSRNVTFPYKPFPVPTNVTFTLVLFNCSRLPFDLKESWEIVNYREKTFYNRTDFTRILSFKERNTFDINVEFKLNEDKYNFKGRITLGKLKLNCNRTMINFKKETFSIKVTMLNSLESGYKIKILEDRPANIQFLDLNQSIYSVRTIEFRYHKYGFYMPKFAGYGNDFIEEIYLDTPLIAEFDLNNKLELHTTAEKNNDTINLPPGNIDFSICSDLDETLPWVNCTLTSGDEVKRFEYNVSHNITRDSPLVVNHTYADLGNQTINVKCNNFISSVSFTKTVDVINSCFGDEGIFDRKFSMPAVKMKITDISEVYIANRMSVFCFNDNITFKWKSCESLLLRKGACLFNAAKSSTTKTVPVALNVSIPRWKTYISEPMFIEVIPADPVAYIYGGGSRIAFVNELVTFMALISNNNRNASLEWNIDGWSVAENKTGPTFSYTFDTFGDFRVNLSVDRSVTFSQKVSVVTRTENSIVTHLKCVLNCIMINAISPQIKLAVSSECTNCLDETSNVQYKWSVIGGNITDMNNRTLSGIYGRDFSLSGNTLMPDTDYAIVLSINITNSSIEPYNLSMVFKTSLGGNYIQNVVCKSTFLPEKTAVSAVCTESSGMVVRYLYETITRRWNAYGEAEEVVNYLYSGYEGSINKIPIQTGDDRFQSNVTLRIRIFNGNGDFQTFNTSFQNVTIPTQYVPLGDDDVGKPENLFHDFNKTVSYIRAGGDTMRTYRYVGSIASMFTRQERNVMVTTVEDILRGETDVQFYEDSPVEKKYKEIISKMIAVLSEETKSCTKRDYRRFSLTDIQVILSTIYAVVRVPSYISVDMLENNLIELVENITECFTIRMDETTKPFPNDYIETIEEIMKQIVRIVNVIVDVMLPKQLNDYSELSFETIEADLTTQQIRNSQQQILIHRNLTNQEISEIKRKSSLLLKLHEHEKSIQDKQKEIAEEYFNRLQYLIFGVQSVMLSTMVLGEQMEFQQQYLKVLMIKTTIKDFNAERAKTLNLQKINGTAPNAVVDVKICVFGKNPLIYGHNASTLTSDVLVSNFGNDTIIDVKLKNKGTRRPYKFSPLYSQYVDEKITHFYFDVTNDDDAILIYLKPEDYDVNNIENRTMYWVYVSPKPFPTTSTSEKSVYKKLETSIRNWDSGLGYKMFAPANVCPKGICYLGIKPIEYFTDSSAKSQQVSSVDQIVFNGTNSSHFNPVEANFTLQIITTACRAWNMESKTWESENCQVLPATTVDETVCRCIGHIFSTTFHIPPNLIDLYNVWGKFDIKNASVYGIIIALFVIYVVLAVILRREDKKDMDRWSISFLFDHDPDDSYFYKITVFTGLRWHAGTTSNIFFVLIGSDDDSRTRFLQGGIRKGFSSGSIVAYVFGTKHSLGDLEYIRIWHDSSGEGSLQDWYLNKIEIHDIQTNERAVFLCDSWLSLTKEDGQTERLLPVSTVDSLTAFKMRLASHAQINVTEHHLWLSLFLRPRRSRFSRVHRLSCLMALLFLSMISNAMYYRSREESVEDFVQIGVFKLSPSALFISSVGIIITTIPVLCITILFRNRKVKKRVSDTSLKRQLGEKERHDQEFFVIPETFIREHEGLLPYWIVYMAWAMLTMIVAVSAFFLLLYSMEWGSTKSEEWLSSFILAFLESVTLVDPVKVVFVAVLFATVFKSIIYERSAEMDVKELKRFSKNLNQSSRKQFAAFASSILQNPVQLTQEEIESVRAKRQEEKKAKKALTRLIVFAIYLSTLFTISYLERDANSYNYKSNIENYLFHGGNGKRGFSSITRTEGFIHWLNTTFVPTMYPVKNYANKRLNVQEKRMFKDDASVRVGPAQLRQLRTVPAEYCSVNKITWPHPCVHGYEKETADTAEYCAGWKSYDLNCAASTNQNNRFTAGAWKYTDAVRIWGTPKTGEYGTYDGGGYILTFTKDKDKGQLLIKDMIEQNWIDRQTRAIFLEFTLYNANRNLFVHAIFLTEFLETGGLTKWTEIQAFRPILISDTVGNFKVFCYIAFIIYILITTTRVVFKIKINGCSFFTHPWNLVIVLNIFLGYTSVAVYIVRAIYAKKAMNLFYDKLLTQEDKFINFNNIIIWDNIFNAVFATLVFLSTLQLLNILGYNKRFTQIISVVVNAGPDIGGFGFIFLIIYVMFVILGTLLFGVQLRDYRDILSTCGTLANSFIGKNNLKSMVSAVPTFAEFFYFMYMFCVIMTLITIFAAILNQSISDVSASLNIEYNKLGMKFYISKTIKEMIGMVFRTKTEHQSNVTKGNLSKHNMSYDTEAVDVLHLLSRSLHQTIGRTGEKTGENNIESGKRESNKDVFKSLDGESDWRATETERNVSKREKTVQFDDIAFKFI